MSQGLDYDEEASRRLEMIYVTSDVIAQRQAVVESLQLQPGERVLDVGSGPGFLVSEIAEVVGPSGVVYGVDISESMVEMARQRCADFRSVTIEVGDAHHLKFVDSEFDVVVSTQVLEYLTDPVGALAQMYRILCPGGRIEILATDWTSMVWHGSDKRLMDRVLMAWSKHCLDPHLPRTLSQKLRSAGFEIMDRRIIPIYNLDTHEGTYSGRLIDLITQFVSGRSDLTAEELDAWANGLRVLNDRGAYFFSLNRYLFVARKPS
jgi:arsenite methyltransferase